MPRESISRGLSMGDAERDGSRANQSSDDTAALTGQALGIVDAGDDGVDAQHHRARRDGTGQRAAPDLVDPRHHGVPLTMQSTLHGHQRFEPLDLTAFALEPPARGARQRAYPGSRVAVQLDQERGHLLVRAVGQQCAELGDRGALAHRRGPYSSTHRTDRHTARRGPGSGATTRPAPVTGADASLSER